MTAAVPLVERLAEALAGHRRGDWSDRTYNCQGCVNRFEQEAQADFDAQPEKPTREQIMAFRNEYAKVSHPGWAIEDYNAHVARALLPVVEQVVAEARGEALRAAADEAEALRSFAHGKNPTSEAHLIGYGTARRVIVRQLRERADAIATTEGQP